MTMRRTIPITVTPQKPGGKPETRLFLMSDRQAQLFGRVSMALARSAMVAPEAAEKVVEDVLVKMFAGSMPPQDAPRALHELRLHFPILKRGAIRKLPRMGCPRGRIDAIVLQIRHPQTGQKREVLVALDRDQADFFNDTIDEVVVGEGCTRDEAWVFAVNLIGMILGGAELKPTEDDQPHHTLLLRAFGLFSGLSAAEGMALPLATEEDVRRCCFTTAPSLG